MSLWQFQWMLQCKVCQWDCCNLMCVSTDIIRQMVSMWTLQFELCQSGYCGKWYGCSMHGRCRMHCVSVEVTVWSVLKWLLQCKVCKQWQHIFCMPVRRLLCKHGQHGCIRVSCAEVDVAGISPLLHHCIHVFSIQTLGKSFSVFGILATDCDNSALL